MTGAVKRKAPAPVVAPVVACSVCGSREWIGCEPGTVAEAQEQGNLFILTPAPEVPLRAWCAAHWPWLKAVAA